MKYRSDFVTNSSSSSYTCDICGRTESGWDISLSEAGMFECVDGHTICKDEMLPVPRAEMIKFMDLDDVRYEISEAFCPVC